MILECVLGIVVVIKKGPAAQLLSWQGHDSCNFVSFVMYISGAKFNFKNTAVIFLEIFLI